jgi:uncharacterized protein (TIGR02001 family)
MKKLLLGAALLLASTAAYADDTIRISPTTLSGDVGVTTDYRNRGISRTDDHPALQGRLQLNHPMGIYGGVSGSTVDMHTDDDANVEAVLFGGYKGNVGGVDYKADLSYNAYPGGDNDDEDYWEFNLTGGYDFGPFYGSLTWAFSPDYINSSGASFYYGGDVSAPLAYNITAKGHMGFQFVDDEDQYVSSDYMDWSLGGWYNYAPYDVDLGLEYVDTNLDNNECAEKCGAQLLVRAKKDFGW